MYWLRQTYYTYKDYLLCQVPVILSTEWNNGINDGNTERNVSKRKVLRCS